jgi:signal transduction histidine kinase
MTDLNPGTVLSSLTEPDHARTLADVCAGTFPNATVQPVHPDGLSRLPAAIALVVCHARDARVARAAGFDGGIIVVGAPDNDEMNADALAQGTHFAEPSAFPSSLRDAVAAACDIDATGAPRVAEPGAARRRRLLAAGELALGLQHTFNNPLAALMTEIQLLQLDSPTPAVRDTADRMLELVRRLTEIARSLDAVRTRPRVK